MPGVLKLEGTNIATGDGNGAVTINNATLPTKVRDRSIFYHAHKHQTTLDMYANWRTSANTENTRTYVSGIAPYGFTSIANMYWWFIAANGGTHNYQAELAWSIAADGEAHNGVTLSDTSFFSGASIAEGKITMKSFLGVGSSGSRFEDLIAERDAFGINIKHNINLHVRCLGAEIIWRF